MGGRGRVDVHHHIVPPGYKAWLESNGVTAGGLAIPSWSVDVAIDEMDANEIATAVVSVSTPGVDVASGSQAGAKAREVNEYAAEVCRTHPDRFAFFATLTLPDVDGSLEEARYALDQLGALGVILPASVRGRYLGDTTFRPLFKELDRSRAVVFVHPSGLPTAPVAGQPPYVVDFLLDTTRSALSMAHGGVLDLRHLEIILSHGGGFLPYAAYRVAPFVGTFVASLPTGVAVPPGVEPDPFRAVKTLRRYYFDVALSGSPSALPSLLAFAAPGHVLFGSDYPYAPAMPGRAMTAMLDAYQMPDDVRRSIDHGAAQALFPRLARGDDSPSASPRLRRPRWWQT